MRGDGDRFKFSRRRRTARSRWRRRRLIRRSVIAALVGLAVLSLGRDLTRSSPADQTITVAIAGADLTGGTALAPDDVAVTTVAVESPLANAALAPSDVLGRMTTGPLRAGEPITATRLISGEGGGRPGFTTMPVTFASADIAGFLAEGMVVDLVWTPGEFGEGSARIVARGARIVRVPQQQDPLAGRLPVLVEVTQDDAMDVAAAMSSGSLSVLVSTS